MVCGSHCYYFYSISRSGYFNHTLSVLAPRPPLPIPQREPLPPEFCLIAFIAAGNLAVPFRVQVSWVFRFGF